jgi:hypothetical protein
MQDDDRLVGQHERLDAAAQAAEGERRHRLPQLPAPWRCSRAARRRDHMTAFIGRREFITLLGGAAVVAAAGEQF